MTLTVKLDRNWSSFQLANSAPPLSVTGSAIAPSARMQTNRGTRVSPPRALQDRGHVPAAPPPRKHVHPGRRHHFATHTRARSGSMRRRLGHKGRLDHTAPRAHTESWSVRTQSSPVCHARLSLCITAFTSERTNLSPFTKGCREWDASM